MNDLDNKSFKNALDWCSDYEKSQLLEMLRM